MGNGRWTLLFAFKHGRGGAISVADPRRTDQWNAPRLVGGCGKETLRLMPPDARLSNMAYACTGGQIIFGNERLVSSFREAVAPVAE